MITGRRRLSDSGLALGVQTCQQQAGLDLGTGHRQGIIDTLECLTAANFQWWTPLLGGFDDCAHFPQRVGNPVHRPLGQ
ncbi:hypothetical protein D3C85_1058810 [compost metagenome]